MTIREALEAVSYTDTDGITHTGQGLEMSDLGEDLPRASNEQQSEQEQCNGNKSGMWAAVALVVALLLPCPAQAGWYRDANTWVHEREPLGHALHLAAGTAVAYTLRSHGASAVVSVAVPAAMGIIKESTDKNFDALDMLSWIAGGVLGTKLEGLAVGSDAGRGAVVGIESRF